MNPHVLVYHLSVVHLIRAARFRGVDQPEWDANLEHDLTARDLMILISRRNARVVPYFD
jgi:hypothetical protein